MPQLLNGDHVGPDLATHARAEIRAHLGRKDLTRAELAETMDVSFDWLSRRMSGTVGMTLEDLQVIADGLGVDARTLLP